MGRPNIDVRYRCAASHKTLVQIPGPVVHMLLGLKGFGKPVIATNRAKIKTKMNNHNTYRLLPGYAKNHADDPQTRVVILSRDVTFLVDQPLFLAHKHQTGDLC